MSASQLQVTLTKVFLFPHSVGFRRVLHMAYDTMIEMLFNVRSKADISQLNLLHETDN